MISLLKTRSKHLDHMINVFGVLGFINFFGVFLYKDLTGPLPFFHSIRFWGALFCLTLLLLSKLPSTVKIFKYFYWYFVITFCLPFYGTIIFLENHNSFLWQSKIIIGLIWLVFITNWIEFLITLLLGITTGIIFYHYLYPNFDFSTLDINKGIFYNYSWSVLVSMVFIHRKDEMSAILIKSQQQEILYQKVRSINSSLEKKVEARTQQLQHALEVKSRFLRNISHEIRIPLHGIINLSTIVNEQWSNLPELKKKELIEHLAKSSDRLMSLVSNLLDISVMTENKLKLYKSECDLIQLTQEVINEFKLTLENKNILLDLNNTEKMLCLCDKERISQVIRNLISNAIKYGNNTPITIALERKHNNTIQLAISDQGVGIPDNELEHIFKQFEESSRTRTSAGGTGLGLAICKEIITAHHGTIRATNNKTKGSTFIFDIPTDLITTQLPQQQKTVLIIDDEEVILTSTSLTLELLGYKVICAQRASEALLILDATIPDLILLDLMMPETNGGQLLHKLRYSKKFKHIPVIVQTGFSNAAELAGIKKLGISGLLKKPYGKKEIIKVLSKIF